MVSAQKVMNGGVQYLALGSTGSGGSCCNKLKAALGDEVSYPSSNKNGVSSYELLNRNRWSETSILSPSCIFTPSNANHVAAAVEILAVNKCKFSIKSGGHMPVAGANNIDGGVAIDLAWLNGTILSSDQSYVSLGSGATWEDAYDLVADKDLSLPGGLCATTGIGGLSTGGGMSMYQPRVGWVVDNILNYEVVLGSGDVVNANETHNSDLYKALKGGSSNFGIVTRVDLATFKQGPMWAGMITVPAIWPNIGNSLKALQTYTEENNDHVAAGVQLAYGYLGSGMQLIDVAIASTDGSVRPDILKPFTKLRFHMGNTVGFRSIGSLAKESGNFQPKGWRDAMATVTFVNTLETLERIQSMTDEVYQTIKHVPGLDYIFMYVPQPRVVQRFAIQRGGNMLGLDDIEHDQISLFLTPRYKDPSYDDEVKAAVQLWATRAEQITRSLGTYDPFLYVGFAGGFQKPLCSYGEKNLEFMKRVAAKYDPDQIFQKLVPGGFKLDNAC